MFKGYLHAYLQVRDITRLLRGNLTTEKKKRQKSQNNKEIMSDNDKP